MLQSEKPGATIPLEQRLTKNALKVLRDRRYLKSLDGQPETPEQMFRRVAENIASVESRIYGHSAEETAETAERFYRIMADLEFLPNSPTLMNAGGELQQLAACFVVPVADSMDSIFEALKGAALIHKSGGGTGFDFSKLRPDGDMVGSTGGVASGPLSFIKAFNAATEAVKQGGTRRGANMGILRVDHPDILNFISVKENNKELANFNLSVAITDTFMDALRADREYALINPRTNEECGRLRAKKVFDLIVDAAWKSGEPGVVFIDRINAANPTPQLGPITSTNPCGEQPLLPYEACNLGSINLSLMVRRESGQVGLDFDRLERVVKTAVRFLDDVIDAGVYPLPQITEMVHGNRKIGLGVMGFADMLIQLGIPYDSWEAARTAEELMDFIHSRALQASVDLAAERGPFPNVAGSVFDRPGTVKPRNATTTTIAPTGTLATIAGCSSGIEPIYAVCSERHILDTRLIEVNGQFEEIAERRGFHNEALFEEILAKGSIREIEIIPEEVQRVFVTSHDTAPEWHVRIQAAFQRYTDNAVSKTVNFPHNANRDDIRRAYLMGYEQGCKGLTVYRDGSRETQVLVTGKTKVGEQGAKLTPRPRPDVVYGMTRKMKTGCGSLFVTINEDEKGQPFEIFAQIGKAGGCASSQTESTARLCSALLRLGAEPELIVQDLRGISCHLPAWVNGAKVHSCADAIAQVLEGYLSSGGTRSRGSVVEHGASLTETVSAIPTNGSGKSPVMTRGACSNCGSSALEHSEGCVVCRLCGFSECG